MAGEAPPPYVCISYTLHLTAVLIYFIASLTARARSGIMISWWPVIW